MIRLEDIDPDVRGRARLAWLLARPVRVAEATADLDGEMRDLAGDLAERHAGRAPSEVPELQPARDLYRSFGVDPTRTRPSSEALFRRAVAGKPLPKVFNAVDVANLCSLRYLLSLGLYDADRLQGRVRVRTGAAGDAYPGIRRGEIHLEGRLALYDDAGPFGNPTADSLRTSVTPGTRALALVVFAPSGHPTRSLASLLQFASDRIRRYLAPPGESCGCEFAIVGEEAVQEPEVPGPSDP